jgi:hypothetical protein
MLVDCPGSLVLALQGFLGFLFLLDVLDVSVKVVDHGLWVDRTFSLGFDLSWVLLFLLFVWVLLSLRERVGVFTLIPVLMLVLYPVIGIGEVMILASIMAVMVGWIKFRWTRNIFFWVLSLLLIFELLSLTHWAFFVPLGLNSLTKHIASIETDLYFFYAGSAPYFFLIFVILSIIKLGYALRDKWDVDVTEKFIEVTRENSLFFLYVMIVLSILVAAFPYLPAINPDNTPIGVDTEDYVEEYLEVEHNPSKAFSVMGGNRPVVFLLIYLFQRVGGLSADQAVMYLPLILNPLLVFSTYLFGVELFDDLKIAETSVI